jgi:hypothetical protein
MTINQMLENPTNYLSINPTIPRCLALQRVESKTAWRITKRG